MNYNWKLSEANFTKDKGKVFSCFACGGGSTMGYKLAGYDVIGSLDIDPKMMEIYRENHKPKYSFIESITEFKNREDLPSELFNLDILDGSPPCSSFSMAGNREKDWGKSKKFREGQAEQVLDTLFFDFIDLAERLKPKVVVAENVKGLLLGNAKKYLAEIYKAFDKAGYHCQHFLLNAADMGVPQRRERVFFICLRKDLSEPFMEQVDLFLERPEIKMEFNEPWVKFNQIKSPINDNTRLLIGDSLIKHYEGCNNQGVSYLTPNETRFGFFRKVMNSSVMPTITSNSKKGFFIEEKMLSISDREILLAGSFPQDYNFLDQKCNYVVGMSVPPLMTAKISEQIHKQWLSRIEVLNEVSKS